MNNRAQGEVYWKIVTYLIALALLLWLLLYYTGLKDKAMDLVKNILGVFK